MEPKQDLIFQCDKMDEIFNKDDLKNIATFTMPAFIGDTFQDPAKESSALFTSDKPEPPPPHREYLLEIFLKIQLKRSLSSLHN